MTWDNALILGVIAGLIVGLVLVGRAS